MFMLMKFDLGNTYYLTFSWNEKRSRKSSVERKLPCNKNTLLPQSQEQTLKLKHGEKKSSNTITCVLRLSFCSCWITFWSPSFDIWRWNTYQNIWEVSSNGIKGILLIVILNYHMNFERKTSNYINSITGTSKPFLRSSQYLKIYRCILSSFVHPSRLLQQPTYWVRREMKTIRML